MAEKRGVFTIIIVFLMASFVSMNLAHAALSSDSGANEWRMFGRNNNHTAWDGNAYSTITGLNVASFTVGGTSFLSTSVGNGYVYVGNNGNLLYQLNSSNVSLSITSDSTSSAVYSSPAIANGCVYIGVDDGKFYQLNASSINQTIASYNTASGVHSSPAVANGYVYVTNLGSGVIQLNASNISKFVASYPAAGVVYSSPAVANGYVYVGSNDGNLYQLNSSNVSKFISSYSTGPPILSSPAVANGFVYFGNYLGDFYQLNASDVSQLIAKYSAGINIQSSPAVANEYVYFGDDNGQISQLNASNVSKFVASYSTGNNVSSSPAVANGYVYVGSDNNMLFQLNASDVSQVIASLPLGNSVDSSPAVANGYVYIGVDNSVYQLNSSNISLTNPVAYGTNFSGAFNATWKVNQTGASGYGNLTLPLENGGVYNFTIDWGDGTPVQTVISWNSPNRTHSYSNANLSYNTLIAGTIRGWRFNSAGDYTKLTSISHWGNLNLGNNGSYFYGCNNFKYAITDDVLNLTGTTSLTWAFRQSGIINISTINSWDVSKVTIMSYMFTQVYNFNQLLDNWNTSNVGNMEGMFFMTSSFNQPLNNWDVSKVTNMKGMFSSESAFNQPLNSWNTSSVTDMSSMFWGASSFNQNISNWDVSGVYNMPHMFDGASAFNQNINSWNVWNVGDMSYMFNGASAFNQSINNWDVSKVTNMGYMFDGASAFNQPLNSWNVSNVMNMQHMFSSAFAFNQPLNSWNTQKVTDMSYMFSAASAFNQPLNNWDVSKVTNMQHMLEQASAFNQPLNSWNVSSVTNMQHVFDQDVAFNQNLSNWDTSQVADMNSMFFSDSAFNQPLNSWNVSSVTNMTDMLTNSNLSTINYGITLIGWNSLPYLKNNTVLSIGPKYKLAANASRANIIATYNWTIIDGGLEPIIPPYIVFLSPANGTYYTSKIVLVNISSNGTYVWFTNLTGNETYISPVSRTWNEGTNILYGWANDSGGNLNYTSVTFFVDSTPPNITSSIITAAGSTTHPVNGTTATINMNATDTNLASTWVRLTYPNNTWIILGSFPTSSFSTSQNGTYLVEFFANDTFGNMANVNSTFKIYNNLTNINITVNVSISVQVNISTNFKSNMTIIYSDTGEMLANEVFNQNLSSKIISVPEANTNITFDNFFGSDNFSVKFSNLLLQGNNVYTFLFDKPLTAGFIVVYSANVSFSNFNAELSLGYNDTGVNEANLHLFKCDSFDIVNGTCLGSWTDVASNPDTINNRFVYSTTSFSGFGIKEYTPPVIQTSSGGGGGGGGGCSTNWTCSAWNECKNGTQTRNCTKEINGCYVDLKKKPTESQSCLSASGKIPAAEPKQETKYSPAKKPRCFIIWIIGLVLILFLFFLILFSRGKYKCEYCGKKFRKKKELEKHVLYCRKQHMLSAQKHKLQIKEKREHARIGIGKIVHKIASKIKRCWTRIVNKKKIQGRETSEYMKEEGVRATVQEAEKLLRE